LWNDKQRKWFMLHLLSRCRPSQLSFLEDCFDDIGVFERKDFTQRLPKYLSVYIFSFLSPQDLSRCAQVSSHWKFLSEQVRVCPELLVVVLDYVWWYNFIFQKDDVWIPKCVRLGWYLPYKPSARELGAWKNYYLECVNSIRAKPLSKEEGYKFRETLFKRELTDREKETFLYSSTKRTLSEWEAS
jgi:hypothetical protein